MSKYDRLRHHLGGLATDSWEASFTDIEAVLRGPLPPSARTYTEWWSNNVAGGGRNSVRGTRKPALIDAGQWRESLRALAIVAVGRPATRPESQTMSRHAWSDRQQGSDSFFIM